MIQCSQHQRQNLDFVCQQSTCPLRGPVCRTCIVQNHVQHEVLPLNEFLNQIDIKINQDPVPSMDEEQRYQRKVLNSIDELRSNLTTTIARVRTEAQNTFNQELQIRDTHLKAIQRQKELTKQITPNMNPQLFKSRVVELLHRQQVRYPLQNLALYEEIINKIETFKRDFTKQLNSLFDKQKEEIISQQNVQTQKASSEKTQIDKIRSDNKQTEKTPPQQKYERSRSPIFKEIPTAVTPNRKQLQQRDLDVVGQYISSKPPDSSRNYFNEKSKQQSSQRILIQNLVGTIEPSIRILSNNESIAQTVRSQEMNNKKEDIKQNQSFSPFNYEQKKTVDRALSPANKEDKPVKKSTSQQGQEQNVFNKTQQSPNKSINVDNRNIKSDDEKISLKTQNSFNLAANQENISLKDDEISYKYNISPYNQSNNYQQALKQQEVKSQFDRSYTDNKSFNKLEEERIISELLNPQAENYDNRSIFQKKQEEQSIIKRSPSPINQVSDELNPVLQAMHTQVIEERDKIIEQQDKISNHKNRFKSEILLQSQSDSFLGANNSMKYQPENGSLRYQQDMVNSSSISSRSLTPPPIKKQSNLKSPFNQTRIQNWRCHDKAAKDCILMDLDKIITCGNDALIKIWDKNKGVLKMALEGHEKAVLCMDFNQKKRILVSGSSDRSVRIWKPAPIWQCVQKLVGHTDRVRTVCLLSSTIIASGGDDCTVRIWDLDQGGACVFTHSLENKRVTKIIPNSDYLIVAAGTSLVTIDTSNYLVVHQIDDAHQNLICTISILTPNEMKSSNVQQPALLATGGRDLMVKLWALPEMTMLTAIKEDYQPQSVELLSLYIVIGMIGYEGEGKISVWNLKKGNTAKLHEIYSNQSGCNKVIVDRSTAVNKLIIWSVHENKKLEQHMLLSEKM